MSVMVATEARTARLTAARRAALRVVLEHVEARRPLLVLKAPPGSGKTYVLLRAAVLARHLRLRVAVATPTNSQADDLCRRLGEEFGGVPVHRFASHDHDPRALGPSVGLLRAARELPTGPCVVVATASKWAATDEPGRYDLLLVDEAWQLPWAEFVLLGRLAGRFVLVGDPGQIEPTVTIPVPRWETSSRPPHRAAPEVLLRDPRVPAVVRALPVSTRLPHDTAELVRGFYDFPFEAWSAPGARRLVAARTARRVPGADDALDELGNSSVVLYELPTPTDGVVPEDDRALADAAAGVVRRLLARGCTAVTEDGRAAVGPEEVGMAATHRAMNGRLLEALGPLAERVRVDTPERWQGLERKVMVVVHPLSGVTAPTGFDLSTGRLCVLCSRHTVGLVVVSRDNVGATLEGYAPAAAQAPTVEDAEGRGHALHLAAWRWLHLRGRVVRGG